MRRLTRILATGAMLFALGASGARAQEAVRVSSQIAIVSIEAILRDSRVARDLSAQSDAIRDTIRAEISAQDAALKNEEEALVALRAALQIDQAEAEASRDAARLQDVQARRAAFEARARTFEADVRALRRRAADEGDRLKEALDRAMGELRVAVNPALVAAMRARGAAVLLDKSDVLISDAALDLTADVIARLDASDLRIRLAPPPAQNAP